MPRQKSAPKPNDGASFHELKSAKIGIFQQVGHFFTLLSNIAHYLVKNCQNPDARAKFTSQNLMTGQKLTPKIPNAQARTSVPTFIRKSPPPTTLDVISIHLPLNMSLYFISLIIFKVIQGLEFIFLFILVGTYLSAKPDKFHQKNQTYCQQKPQCQQAHLKSKD